MKSYLKKLKDNQLQATVELSGEDLQIYIDKAKNALGRDLEIKGFRKGKIPKDMLNKYLDQERVQIQALDMAIEASLADVIKSNSLDVLETSQLSVTKNDSTQLKYLITLALFPEVKLADLSKIKLKKQDVKVEEKEVEEALETIKNSRSNFIDKDADSTVEEGDRVEVSFEVKKDGKTIEGGISENHPMIVGGKSFIPGFEDKLIGMKKGEERSFSLVAPDDYFYKGIAGKELNFKVKVNDLKKIIRPEANDDFAKTLGRFTSLWELKKNIKEGLMKEKKLKENKRTRLEILDNIIDHSKIEITKNLIEKQLDVMVSDFDSTLHEKGLELGLYLAKIGKTQEELKKDWVKEAEKQVKISLILMKLAKDRSIEASQEEVEEMVNQFIQAAITRGEVSQTEIDPVKIKENIASRIVSEKALEYLESECVV